MLGTTPVYLGAVPLPLLDIMVERPFFTPEQQPFDGLQRSQFVGKGAAAATTTRRRKNIPPHRWMELYPSGKLGQVTTKEASESWLETLLNTGGPKIRNDRQYSDYNAPPIYFPVTDAPPTCNYTMLTGEERSFDVAGSVTSMWRIVCASLLILLIFIMFFFFFFFFLFFPGFHFF